MKTEDNVPVPGMDLCNYVHDLQYNDIPATVIHQAKRIIMDNLATMLAGYNNPSSAGMAWLAADCAGNGTSTVVGSGAKTHCITAAYINASLSQVYDFNDGLEGSGPLGGSYHPGRVLIPSALAVGEKVKASGSAILSGLVAGYDVASRIRNPGYNGIPLPDAFGAAAVVSRLLGLNTQQIANAFGIAGFQTPCKLSNGWHHDTDFIGNGSIAQAGIEGALLAGQGMTGPELNDNVCFSQRFKTQGLGCDYEIMNVYFKPYPTCRKTHSAIEMALVFFAQGINPEQIQEVVIHQNRAGMYIDYHVDAESSARACEFNIHYPVACAFLNGNVGIRQFSKEMIAREEVQSLVRKIRVVADERLDIMPISAAFVSEMQLRLVDGQEFFMKIEQPLGGVCNPMTDQMVENKLTQCSEDFLSLERRNKLIEMIWNLEQHDDIIELMNLTKHV